MISYWFCHWRTLSNLGTKINLKDLSKNLSFSPQNFFLPISPPSL